MRPENKWKHVSQSDEELKKVAMALYNMKFLVIDI